MGRGGRGGCRLVMPRKLLMNREPLHNCLRINSSSKYRQYIYKNKCIFPLPVFTTIYNEKPFYEYSLTVQLVLVTVGYSYEYEYRVLVRYLVII